MDVDPREYEHVKLDDNDVKKVVLGYLVHNCFKETAETFLACTGMKQSTDWAVDIDKRKSIYNHVIEGRGLKAIEATSELAPGLFETNQDLHFSLLSLHFIELIRKRDCTGALEFAQKNLTAFGKEQKYVEKLQDCMALLAYPDPETSPMFHLLNLEYRQNVADVLNRALLANANLPSYTSMERLLQHATLVRQSLHQEAGKPAFAIRSFLGS